MSDRTTTPTLSAEQVVRRLEAFRARRGYLMAHQGVMAAALPELQDAYAIIYKALTLEQRHLEPLEKEFVWLVLLITAGEHIGTHHVALFYERGGTEAQAEAAFRLAAFGAGTAAFEMLDAHWQRHFPALPAHAAYVQAGGALLAGTPVASAWARVALLAAHTARRDRWGVAQELIAAYGEGVPEGKLAEAMSLAMWPCGVNAFLEASEVWLELIRAGRVAAGEAFRAWAAMPGQEGLALPARGPGNPASR